MSPPNVSPFDEIEETRVDKKRLHSSRQRRREYIVRVSFL